MGGGGDAQVARRRGWPRSVRRVEQAQVREDPAHNGRVLHRGDEPQPTATARAGEDIEIEHAVHQGGPSPRARGARGAEAGLAFARMDVRGRAAVADAVRAPARMRGENAVIQNQVDRGARDDGRELLPELDRLEEQTRFAWAAHGFESRWGHQRWSIGSSGITSPTAGAMPDDDRRDRELDQPGDWRPDADAARDGVADHFGGERGPGGEAGEIEVEPAIDGAGSRRCCCWR